MNTEASTCTTPTCCTPESATATPEVAAWVRPHYELERSAEAFLLRVYVPGSNKSNVGVAVDSGVLSLTAKRADLPSGDWKPLRQELQRCDYRLEVRVPETVDVAAIRATVVDGILSLTLPIREADKPRSITVE